MSLENNGTWILIFSLCWMHNFFGNGAYQKDLKKKKKNLLKFPSLSISYYPTHLITIAGFYASS